MLVHCYGHGDLGLALLWGCADDLPGPARNWRPLAASLSGRRPNYLTVVAGCEGVSAPRPRRPGEELDPRRWRALRCASRRCSPRCSTSASSPSPCRRSAASTGANAAELQWVISGYALAFGMVPIIGGRLGDDRGRRRVLLVGIAAFTGFSASLGSRPAPQSSSSPGRCRGSRAGSSTRRCRASSSSCSRSANVAGPSAPSARWWGSRARPAPSSAASSSRSAARRGLAAVLPRQPAVGLASFLLSGLAADPPRSRARRPSTCRAPRLLALGVFGVLFPLSSTTPPGTCGSPPCSCRPRRAGGVPLVGAWAGPPPRPPAHQPRAVPGALVRGGRRLALLFLRFTRDAAGPRVLPAGRARPLGTAVRASPRPPSRWAPPWRPRSPAGCCPGWGRGSWSPGCRASPWTRRRRRSWRCGRRAACASPSGWP